MTTATANTDGNTPPNDEKDDLEGRVPTDNILTGQEGDEAVDSEETEAAMAAGWNKANAGNRKTATDEEVDITDVVLKNSTGKDDGDTDVEVELDADGKPLTSQQDEPPPEDPEIPGLGMKASQVKAHLAELETVKKTAASLAGSLGHLKQLVTQAGKGKEVTADALKNVAEEFGPEFAAALAKDLSTAGFGSGGSVDTAAVEQMVSEQMTRAHQEQERKLERKAVMRAHKDADDHFARPKLDADGKPVFVKDAAGKDVPQWEPGAKHAAFMQFVGALPADRQKELNENGWDSDVIIRALDDFKAHEKKAATKQATQNERINRAVAPTSGSGRRVEQPVEDPVMQGWKNVRGTAPARTGSARR
jgi:hypothetical protein